MSPQNIKNNIVKLRPPVSRDNKSSLYKKASQSVDNDQEKKGNKNIMYSTLEKLFRASNDLNTVGKNIGDIKTYLKKNRYNINNIDVSAKGAYSTIQRTKDIMLLKNYIKEDYDIRRDRNAKIALSEKQLAILSENDRMEADLNLCDNILKRLIYEGHIEKESLE
jgi:gas vesicle protein